MRFRIVDDGSRFICTLLDIDNDIRPCKRNNNTKC